MRRDEGGNDLLYRACRSRGRIGLAEHVKEGNVGIRTGTAVRLKDQPIEIEYLRNLPLLRTDDGRRILTVYRRLGKNWMLIDDGRTFITRKVMTTLEEDPDFLPVLLRSISPDGRITQRVEFLSVYSVSLRGRDLFMSVGEDVHFRGQIDLGGRTQPVFDFHPRPVMRVITALAVRGGRLGLDPAVEMGSHLRMLFASQYSEFIQGSEPRNAIVESTIPFRLVVLNRGADAPRQGYLLVDSDKPGTTYLRLESNPQYRLNEIYHHAKKHRVKVFREHVRIGDEAGTRCIFRIYEEGKPLRKGDLVVLHFERLRAMDGIVVFSRIIDENLGEGWREYLLRIAGRDVGCISVDYGQVVRVGEWGRPGEYEIGKRIQKGAPMDVDVLYRTNQGVFRKKEVIIGFLPREVLAYPEWKGLQRKAE